MYALALASTPLTEEDVPGASRERLVSYLVSRLAKRAASVLVRNYLCRFVLRESRLDEVANFCSVNLETITISSTSELRESYYDFNGLDNSMLSGVPHHETFPIPEEEVEGMREFARVTLLGAMMDPSNAHHVYRAMTESAPESCAAVFTGIFMRLTEAMETILRSQQVVSVRTEGRQTEKQILRGHLKRMHRELHLCALALDHARSAYGMVSEYKRVRVAGGSDSDSD